MNGDGILCLKSVLAMVVSWRSCSVLSISRCLIWRQAHTDLGWILRYTQADFKWSSQYMHVHADDVADMT